MAVILSTLQHNTARAADALSGLILIRIQATQIPKASRCCPVRTSPGPEFKHREATRGHQDSTSTATTQVPSYDYNTLCETCSPLWH